jgi:hypothetical protein
MAKSSKSSQPENTIAKRKPGRPGRTKEMGLPVEAEPYKFKPGQSGNPGGRPKKKPITEIYDRLLADPELVPIIEESVRKMITSGRMVGMLQLKEMAERVEGKVTQAVKLDGEIKVSLSDAIQKARQRVMGK